jgi:anti-anti-sigma factor
MKRPPAVDPWRTGDDIPFDLAVRYSATAPALGGPLGALIDRGHTEIVLDLANVEFMDAAGLGVIAVVSTRLRSARGTFSIRSPSRMIQQLLDISAMTGLVDGAAPKTAEHAPSLPANTGVVYAALRLVAAMARATVGGADGVSVALTRHGQLITVATSDEVIAQMDRDQYATGEGPCMSAAEDGRSFHVESVEEEVRWPRFIPRARHHGIASILSSPLMVAERPVGSLNIYSNAERAFGPHDQELAALFASEASTILAEADVETSVGAIAKRLRDSLGAREIIAQAQGVVMARQGISAEAAYAILRLSSKRSGTTLRECAAGLVDSTTRSDLIGQVGT